MPRKRLTVDLLVCPEPSCQHVGKLPHQHGLRGFCVGAVSEGTAHKKARMQLVTFSAKAPEGENAPALKAVA